MKVGFVGLGVLGSAMARRLIAQKVDLVVWNRTAEKAKTLGVPIAASPAGLMSRVDVVMMDVLDSEAVRQVLTGPGGLLQGQCAGKVIIDHTTNHFDAVVRFHNVVQDAEAEYLECPVIGSTQAALGGTLIMLISGTQPAFEMHKPLLGNLADRLFYLGDIGLATRFKLVNNLVLAGFMTAIAEGVVLAEAAGIPRDKALELLAVGSGQSPILERKRHNILEEDFSETFSAGNMYKDLTYILDLARAVKRPCFTGALIRELYALAFVRGRADQDYSVIYELVKGG